MTMRPTVRILGVFGHIGHFGQFGAAEVALVLLLLALMAASTFLFFRADLAGQLLGIPSGSGGPANPPHTLTAVAGR
jgi:hypothetical protein